MAEYTIELQRPLSLERLSNSFFSMVKGIVEAHLISTKSYTKSYDLEKRSVTGGGIYAYDDSHKYSMPLENYRPVLRFDYPTDEEHPNQLRVTTFDDDKIKITRESINDIIKELLNQN